MVDFYGDYAGSRRVSIDHVRGLPVFIEEFVIPVFKGSTLETEFQFPFDLTNNHLIEVVSDNFPILEDATVTKIDSNSVSVLWASDIIDTFAVKSNSTFRVKATNISTGEVKVYNLITIRVY